MQYCDNLPLAVIQDTSGTITYEGLCALFKRHIWLEKEPRAIDVISKCPLISCPDFNPIYSLVLHVPKCLLETWYSRHLLFINHVLDIQYFGLLTLSSGRGAVTLDAN